MSLIASALKHMLAAGMAHELIIAAVEDMEASLKPEQSARSARNARYYEAHRDEVRLKASERRLKRLTPSETTELANGASSPIPKETAPLDPPKEITLTPAITHGDDGQERKPAAARGSRIPADWQPTPADIEFCRSESLSEQVVQREAAKFRDFWAAKAGAGGVKLDWGATWRNWIRKAISDGTANDNRDRTTDQRPDRRGPREGPFIAAARREIDDLYRTGGR